MRRSSNAQLQSQTSEPLIVVDESDIQENENRGSNQSSSHNSSDEESPTMNPYLLSPWRTDVRKHSLPTPQCSGITASQVRRLSERGESAGPGPRQAEFLATLSTAPAPVPGGRRHSVVTISKVPPAFFGRNRRESVAAFPSSVFPGRILPSRRESIACPPSTEPRGSVHNLQLDIMDDIVQARKVRMKLWNTSSERVCEVQPLDEAGGVQRYTNTSGRRYSDFVGTTLAPIPSSSSKRRASEVPPSTGASAKKGSSGIICTNTDLISILSSLTSSATEINQCGISTKSDSRNSTLDQKRNRLKSNRSNSFDISILHGTNSKVEQDAKAVSTSPSNWFIKRHQPMSTKTGQNNKVTSKTLTREKQGATESFKIPNRGKDAAEANKVVWDERSGSLVDAEALGSAIEVFLRRGGPENLDSQNKTPPSLSPSKGAIPKTSLNKSATGKAKTSWFSNKGDDDSTETCDSSLCSTLKDLFVK